MSFDESIFSRKRLLTIITLCASISLLNGCSDNDNLNHLQAFVADGPKTNTQIKPLPKTPEYHPTAYNNVRDRDPFTSFSEIMLRKEAAADSNGPQPLSHGPIQPLEKYALSSLSITGIVRASDGQLWAVVLAPNAKIYRATIGSYIGTHNGRIIGIDDSITKQSVTIEQYLPNAFGGFKKQQTVLHMQSGT
ncbi:MAG: pilus assembly protein PilP [Acidithiobacillus sp.]